MRIPHLLRIDQILHLGKPGMLISPVNTNQRWVSPWLQSGAKFVFVHPQGSFQASGIPGDVQCILGPTGDQGRSTAYVAQRPWQLGALWVPRGTESWALLRFPEQIGCISISTSLSIYIYIYVSMSNICIYIYIHIPINLGQSPFVVASF